MSKQLEKIVSLSDSEMVRLILNKDVFHIKSNSQLILSEDLAELSEKKLLDILTKSPTVVNSYLRGHLVVREYSPKSSTEFNLTRFAVTPAGYIGDKESVTYNTFKGRLV